MKCLLIVIMLCSCTMHAESKAKKVWRWSVAALTLGAALDYASSVGQYETHPIVRQPNGLFNARRGAALKIGVCTGLVLIGKKYPTVGATANFTAGGVWTGAAIRNWRVR